MKGKFIILVVITNDYVLPLHSPQFPRHVFFKSSTFRCREKSEKQMKREAKKTEKQARKQAHKSNEGQVSNVNEAEDDPNSPDVSVGRYGISPMNQSRDRPSHTFIDVAMLSTKLNEQTVWLRARLHTSRAKGKQCFFILRQQQFTVQCLATVSDEVSKQMIKFASR